MRMMSTSRSASLILSAALVSVLGAVLLVLANLLPVKAASTFTPGNLVVVRVGDGSAALGTVATAVFLDEWKTDGTFVQSVPLPTAVNGPNSRLTLSGSATTEGLLTRSYDGHYVALAGYDAAPGTAGVATTTSSAVNRVVGRVGASGTVDTSTRINALISGTNVRGAATDNGSRFWVSGAANGVVYLPWATTGGTSILANPANLRVVDISAGQLYITSGVTSFTNVMSVGSGLPTTPGQTTTAPAGMPVTGASPYGFSFAGSNVVYVADDRPLTSGGGVQKWTLVGSTWQLTTTFKSGIPSGTRGVTAQVNGPSVNVYATTAVPSSANTLVKFVDDGANLNPTAATVATAAANTVFRGIALAPVN